MLLIHSLISHNVLYSWMCWKEDGYVGIIFDNMVYDINELSYAYYGHLDTRAIIH